MSQETTDNRLTELEVEFRTMNKQITGIASDMKKVLEIATQLTLLNERQTTHRTEIDRAFSEIREVKHDLSLDIEDTKVGIKNAMQTAKNVETESLGWINKGKGAWFAASMLWLVIYAVAGFIVKSMHDDFKSMQQLVVETQYEMKLHKDKHHRE